MPPRSPTTATQPAPHTEPAAAGTGPRRLRAYAMVTALAAAAATTSTWLLTTEPARVAIGIGVLILLVGHVFKPYKRTDGQHNHDTTTTQRSHSGSVNTPEKTEKLCSAVRTVNRH